MVWFGVSNKQREVAEVKRRLKRSGNLEERIVRWRGKELHMRIWVPFEDAVSRVVWGWKERWGFAIRESDTGKQMDLLLRQGRSWIKMGDQTSMGILG